MTDQTQMNGPVPRSPIGPDWQPAIWVCVFFCWGDAFLSEEIIRITGGPAHMGIGFELANGNQVYYENLFAKGFQGPKSIEELHRWGYGAKNRLVEIYWLRIDPPVCERKHVVAHTWVGMAGYAEWKLVAFLWYEIIGKKLGLHIRPVFNRFICSTSAACILAPDTDLTTDGRTVYEVTPKSARDAVIKKNLWTSLEVLGERKLLRPPEVRDQRSDVRKENTEDPEMAEGSDRTGEE
jgi:hypothetical protein